MSLDLLVLIKNWLVSPGWSTSCMALANRAAMISRSVKTAWNKHETEAYSFNNAAKRTLKEAPTLLRL